MKHTKVFVSFVLITLMLWVCSCSNSVVGKYYSPKGNAPCPATLTKTAYGKMIEAAKNSDNAVTLRMMAEGEILNIDLKKSYKIIDQGTSPYEWYCISVDGQELYVSPVMGTINSDNNYQ